MSFRSGTAIDEATLVAMRQCLAHRGPDDWGMHLDGRVGLAATRLAIIDPEGGHQPLANEDGSVWAIQNGEIYNYRQLRRWLLERGHALRTASDTEVLVHLYEELGPALVDRLRGMFALAVWDARRGRLLLARDRLGIKPLFYAIGPTGLVFGSEIKAVLAANVPRRLDPVALHDYLSFDYVPGPRTIFEGIRKLPAAHRLIADPDPRLERYWQFPPPATRPPTPDEAAAQLAAYLDDAVRSHLVSDVPVGAFLSGGLDSSVVVALMARHADRPVPTFSIGFPEKSYSELPYARQVAERFGTQHHEFVVEPLANDMLPGIVQAFDEPFADSSAIAARDLARLASQHAKVVLSGDGGDEVFGGYVIYQADRLASLVRQLPAPLAEGLLPRLAKLVPGSEAKMSWQLRVGRFLANAYRDPLAAHIGWRMIFDEEAKLALYSADHRAAYADRLRAGEGSLRLARRLFEAYPTPDLLHRLMLVDAQLSLVDDMLTKVDRTAMAHGLEVRVPLLDGPLVEWLAGLPSHYKVRRLTLKALLKRTARELLPPEVLHRPKAGFHVPMPGWLKRELRPLVDEVLSETNLRRQGIFDPRAVRRLVDRHMAGRADLSRNIWGLVVFGLWYDRYLGDR